MILRSPVRDPYRNAPVGELDEPLLPRWFVLLAVGLVPVALVLFVVAFFAYGRTDVPVADRRPPPAGGLAHDVGDVRVGELEAVDYDAPCAVLDGVRVAGTEADRALLRAALASLCNVALESDTEAALAVFAGEGGIVRFAAFEATGVDSVADLEAPRILVNARFARMQRPGWIAPLIGHDAVLRAGDPSAAETALLARGAEHDLCSTLPGAQPPSRGCEDAAELLGDDDPLGALRAAGYR